MASRRPPCIYSCEVTQDPKLTCHHIFDRILKDDTWAPDTRALPSPSPANGPLYQHFGSGCEIVSDVLNKPHPRRGDPLYSKVQELLESIFNERAPEDEEEARRIAWCSIEAFRDCLAEKKTNSSAPLLQQVLPGDCANLCGIRTCVRNAKSAIPPWTQRTPDMQSPWQSANIQIPRLRACEMAIFGFCTTEAQWFADVPAFHKNSPLHCHYRELAYPFLTVEYRPGIDNEFPVAISEAQARQTGVLSAHEMQCLLRNAGDRDKLFRSTHDEDMLKDTLTFSAVISPEEILLYVHYKDWSSQEHNTNAYKTSLCRLYDLRVNNQDQFLVAFRRDLFKILRWAKETRERVIKDTVRILNSYEKNLVVVKREERS